MRDKRIENREEEYNGGGDLAELPSSLGKTRLFLGAISIIDTRQQSPTEKYDACRPGDKDMKMLRRSISLAPQPTCNVR